MGRKCRMGDAQWYHLMKTCNIHRYNSAVLEKFLIETGDGRTSWSRWNVNWKWFNDKIRKYLILWNYKGKIICFKKSYKPWWSRLLIVDTRKDCSLAVLGSASFDWKTLQTFWKKKESYRCIFLYNRSVVNHRYYFVYSFTFFLLVFCRCKIFQLPPSRTNDNI